MVNLFRGVSQHRHTKKFEAHIWMANMMTHPGSSRTRGKQLYVGCFDTAIEAAKSYDKASISAFGKDAKLNFLMEDYDVVNLQSKDVWTIIMELRRESRMAASAGTSSKYLGVCVSKTGKIEARFRYQGKTVFLGTYKTEIEAAAAYDAAAKSVKGRFALTNFDTKQLCNDDVSSAAASADDTVLFNNFFFEGFV